MTSIHERKERIKRLKNYINQISISDPSIKFDLIDKIENGKLTNSSQINEEIERLETKMKKEKRFRQEKRIIEAKSNHQEKTFENRNIKIKSKSKKETKTKKQSDINKKSKPKIRSEPNDIIVNNSYSDKYTPKEKENLMSTPKKDKEKARDRIFDYPPISGLNIYHALYSNIYFLFDYIKSDRRKIYKEQNTKLSKKVEDCAYLDEKLIEYKYYNRYIDEFSECLYEAIENIYKYYFKDKESIALVCVPPSKTGTAPQTEKSIKRIEEWEAEGDKKLNVKIHNYSDLLKRYKNVPSSKEGDRELYKHKDSIEYNKDKDISKLNMGIIILDDIATSGNSMYACRDILIENGHENKDIISLAIAKTIDLNTEIGVTDKGTVIMDIPRRVERCYNE